MIEEYKKSDKNDKEIISKLKSQLKKLIDDMKTNAEKMIKRRKSAEYSRLLEIWPGRNWR